MQVMIDSFSLHLERNNHTKNLNVWNALGEVLTWEVVTRGDLQTVQVRLHLCLAFAIVVEWKYPSLRRLYTDTSASKGVHHDPYLGAPRLSHVSPSWPCFLLFFPKPRT